LIRPARRSLVRCWLMVATPSPVRSASAVTSWLSWAASHSTCSRAELLNSAKVLAAACSWGPVGSADSGPRFEVSVGRSFCCAIAASILACSPRHTSPYRNILTFAKLSKWAHDGVSQRPNDCSSGAGNREAHVIHIVFLLACAVAIYLS